MLFQDLGEVRGQHRRRIYDGEAAERGLFAIVFLDPRGGEAKGGLARRHAGQVDGFAARVHDHQLARHQLAAAGFDLLHGDAVFLRAERHVVENTHRRHDEAEIAGDLAAERLDLVCQAIAAAVVDERQQAIAELDLELVEREGGGDGLVHRRLFGFDAQALGAGGFGLYAGAASDIGAVAGSSRNAQEDGGRHARQQRHDAGHERGHAERLGIERQLAEHRLVGGALDARLGDHEASGG